MPFSFSDDSSSSARSRLWAAKELIRRQGEDVATLRGKGGSRSNKGSRNAVLEEGGKGRSIERGKRINKSSNPLGCHHTQMEEK